MIGAPSGTVCTGQCVTLSAVATGGEEPYTYSWDDDAGDGTAATTVCPLTTTTYSVLVRSAESEIVATDTLIIAVVPCDAGGAGAAPDSGAPPAMGGDALDAETAPQGLFCVTNPSFEGATVTGSVTGTPPTAVPMDWQACTGEPTVDPMLSALPAQTGKSFVDLPVGSGMFADLTASLGTTLCAPLEPGVEYSFCISAGVGFGSAPPQDAPLPVLELRGGTSPCDQSQLLWTSRPISVSDSWANICGDFFPTQTITDIVLVPTIAAATGTGFLSYVIVDNVGEP